MAQQLIFTSTPQGLEPGRSGYCTVARHKDLRHRLVRELERLRFMISAANRLKPLGHLHLSKSALGLRGVLRSHQNL